MSKKTFAEELKELHLSLISENKKRTDYDFRCITDRFDFVKKEALEYLAKNTGTLVSAFEHELDDWLYIFLIYKDKMVAITKNGITEIKDQFLNPYEIMIQNRINKKK